MATSYAILMDIHGNKIDLKPIPKFETVQRVSALFGMNVPSGVTDIFAARWAIPVKR
jgi:hypothetical protein